MLPDSLNSGFSAPTAERHLPATPKRHVINVNVVTALYQTACLAGFTVCSMASKRRQDESNKTETKRKKKTCEETAELCSGVEDEQVKRAVREAWSRRTQYSQGQ